MKAFKVLVLGANSYQMSTIIEIPTPSLTRSSYSIVEKLEIGRAHV